MVSPKKKAPASKKVAAKQLNFKELISEFCCLRVWNMTHSFNSAAAIVALKDRNGSSRQAIKKGIE